MLDVCLAFLLFFLLFLGEMGSSNCGSCVCSAPEGAVTGCSLPPTTRSVSLSIDSALVSSLSKPGTGVGVSGFVSTSWCSSAAIGERPDSWISATA